MEKDGLKFNIISERNDHLYISISDIHLYV
jgi:hypothetical protein